MSLILCVSATGHKDPALFTYLFKRYIMPRQLYTVNHLPVFVVHSEVLHAMRNCGNAI
jgi:hypothetical protein